MAGESEAEGAVAVSVDPQKEAVVDPAAVHSAIASEASTRFTPLITVVVAASMMFFIHTFFALPGNLAKLDATNRCDDTALAEALESANTEEDLRQVAKLDSEGIACRSPFFQKVTIWTLGCLAALMSMTTVVYLLYPRVICRRQRLVPLETDRFPNLQSCLDEQCRKIGVSPPVWLVMPGSFTTGGLAFGRLGRRYVRLDAGLVPRFETDPEGFRGVVLHELAHLKNRDIDRTYLTMSVWWSFLILAVLPTTLLQLFSNVLYAPYDNPFPWTISLWSLVLELGSPLLFSGLVYVVRNSVLRNRELHADMTVCEVESPAVAHRTIDRLHQPAGQRWTSWFGHHPPAHQRRRSIDDPRLLTSPSLPEATGIGIVSGLLLWQLFYVFMFPSSMRILGGRIAVSIAGGFMAALLTLSTWRTVVVQQDHTALRRAWLHSPILAAIAFCCGEITFPIMHGIGYGIGSGSLPSPFPHILLGAGFLVTVMVILSLWVGEVGWMAQTHAIHRLPHIRLLIATAGLFATSAFIWVYFVTTTSRDWIPEPGVPPEAGAEIGWYAALTQWVGMYHPSSMSLYGHPTLLLGVTLLWLAPLLLSVRLARNENADRCLRPNYRFALTVGSVGASIMLGIDIALVFLARAALPEEVRRLPENNRLDSASFIVTQLYLWGMLAILTQVVVAVVVTTAIRRHRVILVALATQTAAIIAAFGISVVVPAVANCVDLYGVAPEDVAPIDLRCVPKPDVLWSDLAWKTRWITAHGAIPVMLTSFLAAGAAQVIRRVRGTPEIIVDSPAPGRVVLAVLAFLAIVSIGITGSSLPDMWADLRGFE